MPLTIYPLWRSKIMKKKIEPKVVALVIKKTGEDWSDMVCETEYLEDGTWICGMNLITGIEEVLDRAEKEGLNIIFESRFNK